MRYLHTMIRVSNLDATVDFFVGKLGLRERARYDIAPGRHTLVFLSGPDDESAMIELTHNWDPETLACGRAFGHLAYHVDNIFEKCQDLMDKGVPILRPPRDGRLAFIRTPDGISIELIQAGEPLPAQEPWTSMPNSGEW
jgi:lactoylglutathione lyase